MHSVVLTLYGKQRGARKAYNPRKKGRPSYHPILCFEGHGQEFWHGDLAANTVVVRYPRIIEPDVEQLLAGKFNSLRTYPHLAARLRQRVTPGEAAVALQALLRRDQFDPLSRVELFSELATHFQAKVPFPADATDGITDEQFLRNVVDVIYRARTEAAIAI